MIQIAAATQIRLDSDGRAYYRRRLAAGKTRAVAMRSLKRRISDALHGQLRTDAHTRAPALRISHFPDPHQRRYPRPPRKEDPHLTALEPAS